MIATNPPQSQSKCKEFRERLLNHVLVADGAMGTVLYSKGIFINRCFDELNLSAPALVKETHQEYVKAGAEILETNTFGANRTRLAAFGLAEKLKASTRPACGWRGRRPAIPHSSRAPSGRWACGSSRWGRCRSPRRGPVFREQAEALVEAGVDLLILETFSDLNEIREAIFAAREAAGEEMVIVAQVTIDDDGNMPDGAEPETYTREVERMAGRRHRAELLGRAQSHARDHRADDAVFATSR